MDHCQSVVDMSNRTVMQNGRRKIIITKGNTDRCQIDMYLDDEKIAGKRMDNFGAAKAKANDFIIHGIV